MSMPLRCAQKVALLFVAFSALMVSPVTAAAISLTPSPDAAEQPTTTLPTRGGNFDFSNGIDNKTEVEPRQAAIKVMIVGDSISQGHEGDWTWRYRLWQWFQSEGVAVDFVGPYTGKYNVPTLTTSPESRNPSTCLQSKELTEHYFDSRISPHLVGNADSEIIRNMAP